MAGAFAALGKAIGQAGERELAGVQFEAIAGGADAAAASVAKLEEFSHISGLDFPELKKGVQTLMQAGMSSDDATDALIRIQKIALNTGASAEEMGDIFARVMLKEEVSMKDLNKLAAAGIPGIAGIAKEFKSLEIATKDSDAEIDRQLTLLKRQYEQIRINTGAVNSFGQSSGLMAEAFKAFRESGSRSAGGARVTEFAGVTQGIQELSKGFGGQFVTGIKQISWETGLSENAIRDFIDAGKIGYSDLTAAAGRYRDEQQKSAEQKGEDKKFKNQQEMLKAQRDLVGEVSGALKAATDPGGPFNNIDKYLDTFAGKLAVVKHDADEMFEAFGKPIIEGLKPVLDVIHNEWAPAMQQAAENFGTQLVTEAQKFWSTLTDGLPANAAALGAGLDKAFVTVAQNFGRALLNEVLDALNPKNWFSGMHIPGIGQQPAAGPATGAEAMPTPSPEGTPEASAASQNADKLAGLLEEGNKLATLLNTNLVAVLQTA